eukprot:NODE_3566_length_1328_cov_37.066390_g3117_i0.p1 GENE.NODE_3566_length_1328_cov_37.066390_g3117_i0~~NODE_3566_length_1328_cov_37.066390_g3117_i0.p1  ORF type:complete len:383 (+),score=-26.32 NODE_3566_length_1328_cov_37.066390_g3117_i0:178-1326(+)
MATGITQYEKHGDDAITAERPHRDPNPLPKPDDRLEIQYPNKLAEAEVLKPLQARFIGLNTFAIEQEDIPLEPSAFALSDNLFAMHALLAAGKKANLIYLDPPYGTGLEFQSRQLEHAYKDNRAPASYLEFMRRRLILMRELLTDNGSIYLHIGHQMLFHLKAIMDEVFGSKNFRNLIVRRKCSSKNYTRKQYPNMSDYLLFYTRSSQYKWNQPTKAPEAEWIEREYPKRDALGRYKLVPIHAPGTRRGETGQLWRGMLPPPGKHWQYTPAKLDELNDRNQIHWSRNGNPRRKVYLDAEKRLALTDYWDAFKDAHHQSIRVTGYPTEKNLAMLKLIVGAATDPGDLVLDPFCGSGTTLQAADELARSWIGIDESFSAPCTLR